MISAKLALDLPTCMKVTPSVSDADLVVRAVESPERRALAR